ncbi:MAG: aspartyl protease family protein [Cyclobacteriaceae bacterium]|jgi:hypothetical protein|nr:aspartyl protease family protein [Cyclobacteriaceae bacterium]
MIKILSALVLIFTTLFAQAQLGFQLLDNKKRVDIPIEIYNNLVVVPVVINNTLPLKFIVDTGVRTAILTDKVYTDFLNLTYNRKYTIAGAGEFKLVEAYVTNGVDIVLPGIKGQGHSMLVLEEDYLKLANYLGTNVHGIIGYELFSRFVVKIDYERRVMTVMQPEKLKLSRKYKTIPIKVEDTKPYVEVWIEQANNTKKKVKLMIDSGASHSLLLNPLSDKEIIVPDSAESCVVGHGLGGDIRGKSGRLKNLELGNFNLGNVIVNYPDQNSYMDTLKAGNIFRNGTMGGDMLSRFTVVFNFSNETISLKKNNTFKKGFYYSLSGLSLMAKGRNLTEFFVSDVRKKSPSAKVDIRVGDEIISVNNLSAAELKLEIINGILNKKEGKTITLVIRRKGEILQKRFKLQKLG